MKSNKILELYTCHFAYNFGWKLMHTSLLREIIRKENKSLKFSYAIHGMFAI